MQGLWLKEGLVGLPQGVYLEDELHMALAEGLQLFGRSYQEGKLAPSKMGMAALSRWKAIQFAMCAPQLIMCCICCLWKFKRICS